MDKIYKCHMKYKIFSLLLIFLFCLCLGSCSTNDSKPNIFGSNDNNLSESTDAPETEEIEALETSDMFSDKDLNSDYVNEEYETIVGDAEDVSSSTEEVQLEDNDILINNAGNYLFTGELNNKTIVVDVLDSEKVYLVLKDLNMTNDNYACIYVINADKVFINIDGNNSLNSTNFIQRDDNNVDGAIFSKSDITILGSGTLDVSSSIHGIVGKDDVKITSGVVNVNSASHGISANDSIRITNANVNVTSGKDGIKANNEDDATLGYIYIESGTININASYDGISASYMVQIDSGNLDITTTTNSSDVSSKGIKASSNLILNSGEIVINSTDDSIHSNESISIVNPTLKLSTLDDGVHADTSLVITGGNINVVNSYEGLEGQNIDISGGTIKVVSSDDGINAAGGNDSSSGGFGPDSFNSSSNAYIKITGGNIYIDAQGDGVDSNGSLYVSGGYVFVEGPTSSGNGALDYDGTGEITGGTIIATGASGMAMNFKTATQGSVLINLSISKGDNVSICDSDGNTILSFTSSKSSKSLLFSSPEILIDNSYTITTGSSSQTVTLSDYIYSSSGSSSGMPSRPW